MPFERKPKFPLSKHYIPADSYPYKVMNGDSWRSVATGRGIDVWELINFNFNTKNPEEVNWYLRQNVGCTLPTRDRANWRFSSDAKPGIIYIPIRRIRLPPITLDFRVTPKNNNVLKDIWIGVGKQHSGDLFIVGAHDFTAKIYNLGDETNNIRNAWININGWKFGLGLGGSIGAVLVIAYKYSSASEMNGVNGAWDFEISIGGKFGDFLKSLKGIGKVASSIDDFKKIFYIVQNSIKNRSFPNQGIYTIPIPFAGGGMHLWGGYAFGDVKILSSGVGFP